MSNLTTLADLLANPQTEEAVVNNTSRASVIQKAFPQSALSLEGKDTVQVVNFAPAEPWSYGTPKPSSAVDTLSKPMIAQPFATIKYFNKNVFSNGRFAKTYASILLQGSGSIAAGFDILATNGQSAGGTSAVTGFDSLEDASSVVNVTDVNSWYSALAQVSAAGQGGANVAILTHAHLNALRALNRTADIGLTITADSETTGTIDNIKYYLLESAAGFYLTSRSAGTWGLSEKLEIKATDSGTLTGAEDTLIQLFETNQVAVRFEAGYGFNVSDGAVVNVVIAGSGS